MSLFETLRKLGRTQRLTEEIGQTGEVEVQLYGRRSFPCAPLEHIGPRRTIRMWMGLDGNWGNRDLLVWESPHREWYRVLRLSFYGPDGELLLNLPMENPYTPFGPSMYPEFKAETIRIGVTP